MPARYTFFRTGDDIWAWAKKLITDLNNANGATGSSGSVPAGALMAWPMAAPPLGWLLCDGGSYTKADYGELFLTIAYTYGGAGPLFLVPDMRNRILMGAGATVALGALAGGSTATLATPNLPAHSHAVNDPGHTHAVNDPGHTHGDGAPTSGSLAGALAGIGAGNTASAVTGITLAAANTGITTANTGAGTPFSVLNPVLGVNVIIKH